MMDNKALNSTRPYLVKALYEWINDNALTPYLLVDALQEGAEVPTDYVRDGRIVLNISPTAVRDFQLEQAFVAFCARFSGIAYDVYVPIQGVLAIYAKENGMGMFFEQNGDIQPPPDKPKMRETVPSHPSDASASPSKKKNSKPFLKVIK